MPSTRLLKLAATSVLLAAATGCATVPGDPYYSGGYAPAPIYGGTAVYGSAVYPGYPAYPVVRELPGDRWQDMRNEREQRAWRERQEARERAQWERDQRARRDVQQNRDRDQRGILERQQRDRDLAQRQQRDQQLRERELANRQQQQQRQQQRARSNRNDLNADGSPRTDYDRYNPKTGQWLPRSDQLP